MATPSFLWLCSPLLLEGVVRHATSVKGPLPWPYRQPTPRCPISLRLQDLQYLGRPLQRIIVMDHKPNANPQYTNNTIVIPEWTGGVENMAQDRTLYNILPFLDRMCGRGLEGVPRSRGQGFF